ncbi:MAG: tetratricopeptide repeat protein [Candidatus Marinamargulisbacteria bacterium]
MIILRYSLFIGTTAGLLWLMVDSVNHIKAEIHHRNGFIQQERGYPKLANASFNQAVQLMPWETHYRLQLAKSYENSAKKNPNQRQYFTQLAIKEYETLIEMDPINPWFPARLGLIYHDLYTKTPLMDHYKTQAYRYAKTATENDSQNPLFTLHYAHLLYTYNDFDNAKAYYKTTIKYDDRMLEAHFNLAAIYIAENRIPLAINHYKIIDDQLTLLETAFQKKPTQEKKMKINQFQNARIKLADIYLNTGQLNSTLELINRIPTSVEKYELLARYYEKTNQRSTAILFYKKLKEQLNTSVYNKAIERLSTQ